MSDERFGSWEDAVRSLIDDPAQRDLVEASYYDQPLAAAAARYAASPEWAEVSAFVGSAHGVAVDIGAGNGVVSYALAQDGWTTIAIEPDPSELVGAGAIRRLSEETGVAIDVRSGVGEHLPLGDGEAAFVVARQVLHHARDLQAFAQEIARVLAPGGALVTLRDHVVTGPEQMQAFLDKHPLHRFYGGESAFTTRQYRDALKGAGFIIVSELGSFDSAINYAPHTRDTLREAIVNQIGPLGFLADQLLRIPLIFDVALRMMTKIDNRPGRLVSFYCRKA
jgi:SAM-dependent methyltransferase